MKSTQEILNHHLDCFGRGDLDGILADYSPTAVMFTPTGLLKGPVAIRPVFQAWLTEFAKPGMSFNVSQLTVDGECAYMIWSGETADNVYEMFTDTFIVQNGQIVTHSFAAKVRAKA